MVIAQVADIPVQRRHDADIRVHRAALYDLSQPLVALQPHDKEQVFQSWYGV